MYSEGNIEYWKIAIMSCKNIILHLLVEITNDNPNPGKSQDRDKVKIMSGGEMCYYVKKYAIITRLKVGFRV